MNAVFTRVVDRSHRRTGTRRRVLLPPHAGSTSGASRQTRTRADERRVEVVLCIVR